MKKITTVYINNETKVIYKHNRSTGKLVYMEAIVSPDAFHCVGERISVNYWAANFETLYTTINLRERLTLSETLDFITRMQNCNYF